MLEEKVRERTAELQSSNVKLREEIDIRKKAEARLRESENRYRTIFENTGTATVIIDEKVHIALANSVFEIISGYSKETLEGKRRLTEFLDEKGKLKIKHFTKEPADPQHVFSYEGIFVTRKGEEKDVLITFAAIADTGKSVVSISDISELKKAERQIYHQAFHDSLTNLPNRALFLEHVSMAIKRANRRENYHFAIIYLDIDRFKLVNDSLGHSTGDKLLVDFSEKLRKYIREIDTVARLGGDEFAILLEDIEDNTYATLIAERLQHGLQEPFHIDDHEVFASASCGIVLNPNHYETPEEIIRDADAAMYHAKEMGKAQFRIFDSKLHEKAMLLLQMETDLRKAVDRNEFEINYQPIVSIDNNEILGLESLVRWNHPQQGLLYPDSFISIAEETGIIIPMGKWILNKVCEDLTRWATEKDEQCRFFCSVNISGKQFAHPDFLSDIKEILGRTGVSASCLKLELTETVLMEDVEETLNTVHKLKEMGIQLVIDDFGTGYSSLSYLLRLPIDMLKIDRSFIISMLDGPVENRNIVEAIISLAHRLQLNVVAEGVENIGQQEALKALGCQLAQGYLYSKAVKIADIEQLILQEKG